MDLTFVSDLQLEEAIVRTQANIFASGACHPQPIGQTGNSPVASRRLRQHTAYPTTGMDGVQLIGPGNERQKHS